MRAWIVRRVGRLQSLGAALACEAHRNFAAVAVKPVEDITRFSPEERFCWACEAPLGNPA